MSYNKNNKLVFHKLIEEIGGSFLKKTIRKYGGDYRSQHFDTRSHINSMIYLNIRGCRSLREVESELSSNKKLKSLINVPSVSQFSRKNKVRDYGLFEDKDSIHVFDRGYYDYKWYDMLTEQGIRFVTRGIKNSIVMEEKIIDSKPLKDTYDTEVILGSTTSKNLTTKSYKDSDIFCTYIIHAHIFELQSCCC